VLSEKLKGRCTTTAYVTNGTHRRSLGITTHVTQKFFVLLAAGMLAFSSCESEVITTTPHKPIDTATYRLIIEPSHLEGEQYQAYQFTAHVEELSSDSVRFFWDFGTGYKEDALQPQYWTFFDQGVFMVRVKAISVASGLLLGEDSIRADIRPPVKFIEIFPKSVDTLLYMESDGDLLNQLQFSVRTSIPGNLIETEWDFGDGTPIQRIEDDTVLHLFPSAGTYRVKVTAFEKKNGMPIGTDSCDVNIRFEELTFDDIRGAYYVSVYLMVDDAHEIHNDPLFKNPFAIRFPFGENSVIGNTFAVAYRFEKEGIQFPKLLLDTITGEFSEDLRKIRTLRVSVDDTGHLVSPNRGHLRYTFLLKDLDLVATNDQKITYRSKTKIFSEAATIESFSASGSENHPSGLFPVNTFLPIPERKDGAFAIVVFSR
jgi:hypothetical protein